MTMFEVELNYGGFELKKWKINAYLSLFPFPNLIIEQEAAPDPACDREYSDGSEMHHQDHNCLIKILADLVASLNFFSYSFMV